MTEQSVDTLLTELDTYGDGGLDVLHITSWDADHCNPGELDIILDKLGPNRVEYPGYTPHTELGRASLLSLRAYERANPRSTQQWSPNEIASLPEATSLGRMDVLLWPEAISPSSSNDNSTAKLFRGGDFTVLSLGDLQSAAIADSISKDPIVQTEVDVLILAHHGADNGFTTEAFLQAVNPTLAICSSNYANQYDHPRETIRELLFENNIRLFTTKTGDVVVETLATPGKCRVSNLIANSTSLSSECLFYSKAH